MVEFGGRTPINRQLREWLELIEVAERVGFESVWVPESYSTGDESPNPPTALLVLASLVTHTDMRLGTGVTLLPAWNPLRLAYDAALVDQLSAGRLILGVGLGSAQLGRRFRSVQGSRAEWADDFLRALHALWADRDGYHGSVVSVEGRVVPRPVQPGGPPIWLGGYSERTAVRAATLGDGRILGTMTELQAVDRLVRAYQRALRVCAKRADQPTVAINRLAVVADSADRARDVARLNVGRVLARYARLGSSGRTPIAQVGPGSAFDELEQAVSLVGSPDDVATRLERLRAAGITHVQARVRPAETPIDAAVRTIELMGRELLPRFA
jgi:alkanesulfonate monooxygenase SsuD/methylene tetrahydromethanopterin reductase-like flavin-dependent oxidoreductase (luciferase family)